MLYKKELAFKSYVKKNPPSSDILKIKKLQENGDSLTWDQREKLKNYNDNVDSNINEERQGKVNDYDKLILVFPVYELPCFYDNHTH